MTSLTRDERGLADSTAWALLMPMLLILILGMVSAGVWLHARMGADTAAAAAADRAAVYQSDAAEARRVAIRIAEQAGVADVDVRIEHADGNVIVTVTGSVSLPVDLGLARVSQRAIRPVEEVSRP